MDGGDGCLCGSMLRVRTGFPLENYGFLEGTDHVSLTAQRGYHKYPRISQLNG